MFKNIKNIVLISAVVFFSLFKFSLAFVSIPFGGILAFSIPCTCSAGVFMATYDYRTKLPLFLIYQGGYSRISTVQNTTSMFVPGTYNLGTYNPGGVCLVGAPPFCVPITLPFSTVTPFPYPGIGFGGMPATAAAGALPGGAVAMAAAAAAIAAAAAMAEEASNIANEEYYEERCSGQAARSLFCRNMRDALDKGCTSIDPDTGRCTQECVERGPRNVCLRYAGDEEDDCTGRCCGEASRSPVGPGAGNLDDFVWKPISESDCKLVILLPRRLTGDTTRRVKISGQFGTEFGRFTSVANGNREHYRFSRPGAGYGQNITVTAYLKNGGTETWVIGYGSYRVDQTSSEYTIPNIAGCSMWNSILPQRYLQGSGSIDILRIGNEETVSGEGYRRAISIAVNNNDDTPHILSEQNFYMYNKINGVWRRTTVPGGFEVPRIRIDNQNRAWISWCDINKTGVGRNKCFIAIYRDISTNPTLVNSQNAGIPHFVGYLALDPFKNEAIVIGGNGDYNKFNENLDIIESGIINVGGAGEKIEVQFSSDGDGDGVWHGAMGGYCEGSSSEPSAYSNSNSDLKYIWAGIQHADEAGNDGSYVSMGIDKSNENVAYIAGSYNQNRYHHGVSVNIFNGYSLVHSSAPIQIDPNASYYGNGSRRFSPQWAPALNGGAYLCWTSGDGRIKMKYFHYSQKPNGTETVDITQGTQCAIATDSQGNIHMVYNNGGTKYRKIIINNEN